MSDMDSKEGMVVATCRWRSVGGVWLARRKHDNQIAQAAKASASRRWRKALVALSCIPRRRWRAGPSSKTIWRSLWRGARRQHSSSRRDIIFSGRKRMAKKKRRHSCPPDLSILVFGATSLFINGATAVGILDVYR